ncbi:hypothetical protein OTU49_008219 [Cherax quadricarinatus]|uniref:Single domain-containing protein n=1 Tax=Cherax quadricarinatus TaxID=27406 RepID=A0AAW0WFC6_CHEQU
MDLCLRLVVMTALLAASFSTAKAALSWQYADDPNNPNSCLYRLPGSTSDRPNSISMRKGTTFYLPHCQEVTCTKDGNRMVLRFESCGVVGVPPPCRLRRDEAKNYPACCPVPVCPNGA